MKRKQRKSATPSVERKAAPKPERRVYGPIAEWTVNILIFLFGTTTLLQGFVVPTSSMENTVLVGDHLFVDKLAYAPADSFDRHLLPYQEVKRGDIIVFRYPVNPGENYVKRVIGVPGDHIRMHDKRVYRNGVLVPEPFTRHIDPGFDPYRDNFPAAAPDAAVLPRGREMLRRDVRNGELVVPPGQYFAMGDNRDNSADSRYWGLVPRENIVGKPLIVYWSYDAPTEELLNRFSPEFLMDLAGHFFTRTRWERCLRLVRSDAD